MPNEHQRASKMQPKADNSEKLATLGTQDTRRRQTKQKNNTTNISFFCFVFLIRIMSICTDEKL